MPTRAGRLQCERYVYLLARADLEEQPFALLERAAAAIEIQHQISVDQIAVLLQQKRRPVGISSCLLIRGECDDDVACRPEALALQANQTLHERRIAPLHIFRTAPVKPAVLLRELEGIPRPVL